MNGTVSIPDVFLKGGGVLDKDKGLEVAPVFFKGNFALYVLFDSENNIMCICFRQTVANSSDRESSSGENVSFTVTFVLTLSVSQLRRLLDDSISDR